ncbi:MAG: type II secretion system protein GspD [Alphaproteobacteria bacterium]
MRTLFYRYSRFFLLFLVAPLLLTVSGCDAVHNFQKPDREANLETQDIKDGLAPRPVPVEEAATTDASIPALQPYMTAGALEQGKAMPLVSVSVNQTVPVRDILFELAQQADYDLELDPRITGSIIYTARERPFDQVIDRISEIAGLRYKFEDNVLRVELDTPFNKSYKVDYLSYVRLNKGTVRNDIAVVSGEGADTGSSFESTSSSEADFWGELDVNLQQILGSTQGAMLRTRNDPRITAAEQNPADVQAVVPTDAAGNPIPGAAPQAPAAVLRVESLPTDDAATGGVPGGPTNIDQPTFAINRQAGLINVYASQRAHKEIDAYLKLLRRSVTAQVLIEAKILEVTLNDEYSTGIDWRALGGNFNLGFLPGGTAGGALSGLGAASPGPPGSTFNTASNNFVLGYSTNNVQAVLQAISGFGSVRALASPRLTVLNNQSAVLNVANNRVFFEIDIDVTTEEGVSQVDIDSDIRNVPEGVLVNVQPSINLDNQTVSMAVRPTITRIVNEKPDPAIQYVTAAADITGVESLVPELNVQEIDSVIQVNSGQAIVMGGLLQDRSAVNQEGVPVLGDIPVAGALFRQHNDLIQKTELVILLKATILEMPAESVHDTDKDIYRGFSSDRRPFKL